MCQRNWRQYNAGQVQKGSLSFICDPTTIRAIRKVARQIRTTPKGGRPPFPPQLILMLLILKISYGLSYRSSQGMALSLLAPLGILVPHYSTICRGIRRLSHTLPKLSRRRPRTLLIDSSGFKVFGEGEWKVKVHGKSRRRKWRKVHLLVDSDSNEIIDLFVTDPHESDLRVGLRFLDQAPATARSVLADGAYDGRAFRRKAFKRRIEAVVPPPCHATLSQEEYMKQRNDAICTINSLGSDRVARRIWGKLAGYHHRVKVESAFSRLKRLFGGSFFSRRKDAQTVEMWVKAMLSNNWLKWASS